MFISDEESADETDPGTQKVCKVKKVQTLPWRSPATELMNHPFLNASKRSLKRIQEKSTSRRLNSVDILKFEKFLQKVETDSMGWAIVPLTSWKDLVPDRINVDIDDDDSAVHVAESEPREANEDTSPSSIVT